VSKYSIKELEQLSGIKAHTLRIWEQRYNFIKPKRTETNIRFYNDNDLKLILNVSLLKENGHKISKISRMCSEEMQSEVVKLTQERLTFPEQMHAMTLAMIDCDEKGFQKIMETNVAIHGMENFMLHLVFPFLHKVGIMWQTGSVSPSHEHFISGLIHRKLEAAIDHLPCPDSYHKRFLLFLPEGELHDLSLLFSSYLLKKRHHEVIYLGPNLPLYDLASIYESHHPDYFLTILTSHPPACQVSQYIRSISELFPESTILIAGRQVACLDIDLPSNFQLLLKIEDLLEICE
jgi:DNA-binding transcriptional MerR regulator